jgi:cytochrome c biogenesis protein CcmG/thiol:disulfide interchange protein DsbE
LSEAPRRVKRPTMLIAAVVGLVMVAFVAVLATRATQPGTVSASPLVGQVAPAISGTDVVSGRAVSLLSERGHYVVVTFFASWCAPCIVEAPQLVAFLFAERAIHARVLGVIYNDSVPNAKSFLAEYGASWPAVADPTGATAADYGVSDPPESFVIAPSGRVVAKITGGVSEHQLLGLIGLAGSN